MTDRTLNILVFPAGTETGMEIQRSLAPCKEVRLVGATSGNLSHAEYVFKQCYQVRDVREEGWLEDLNAIIAKEKIDYVFPAHAYVLKALSEQREKVLAPLVAASDEAISTTRSKARTLALLKDVVPVPRMFETIPEIESFPVFLKPDDAYGAQGTMIVHTEPELRAVLVRYPGILMQEVLPGEEVTCDCLSDGKGQLVFARARYRRRIRMGTSMRSEFLPPEENEQFKAHARRIAERIPIAGAWFFQMKADRNGVYRLLEVEARIAGTMCLNRVTGVNFALLSILAHCGKSFEIETNESEVIVDRALTNRYRHQFDYDVVYVDLDDTLIVRGKVNASLVSFLYQALNEGKKLVLVSKSLAADKLAFLAKYRLREIFDEIIWLTEAESKADVIRERKAIFIDDSFSQRREVSKKCRIPTFDPSMIEVLLSSHA